MNKVLKWILIGLGIAVVVFLVAMIAFRGFAWSDPPFMMGGRVPGFHHPFGGMMFGMGLLFLFTSPVGWNVLGLAVFGLITLFTTPKECARYQQSTPVDSAGTSCIMRLLNHKEPAPSVHNR